MIDVKATQQGIILTINNLIGKNACPDRKLLTSPAIRAKQKGSIPDFPVAVVDTLSLSNYGITSTSEEYYNDDEDLVRKTQYKLGFMVDIHGSVDDNVLMIAQVLRDTLFRDYGRAELETNITGKLLGISSPSFSFNYLNTDYEEVARLVIDLSVTDVHIENEPDCPSTGSIENIVVDGELKDSEDDADPLDLQATAP